MTARGLVHITTGDPNPKVISSLLLSMEDASKTPSTSKSSVNSGSAMAAAEGQSGNAKKRKNNRNNNSRNYNSNSNSSGNSSGNSSSDNSNGSGFVQNKDCTCYKCHKRGHMAKSCRSAGGNYRNDTNPRSAIVCYRCNLTGHIGRNCPQNGDLNRNGGNGSTSGNSSGTSGLSGSSGPRPLLALGLSSVFPKKEKIIELDVGRRSSNVVDNFVWSVNGRGFGDSVALSNFGNAHNVNIGSNYFLGNSTALNLGEENAYIETNDDNGVNFVTFVVDSGATSHFLKHPGILHDKKKVKETLQSAHREVSLMKEGVGRLRVLAEDGNVYWLNEVFYVPSLSSVYCPYQRS
ncbi:uncharacterized protein DDB_G0283357-like [Planococcus citri]|uniref:uncharacterized protein DDB_G0283357-like n=1 Tax=Planococcus citri TaxID=170843 RepID=UPI0031F8CBBC